MKKKIIAIVCVAVLVISMATAAFAVAARPQAQAAPAAGYGCGGYSLMWDEDGNFLDQEAFEENLDKLIEDGVILEADRDFYVDRYDWCATNGGGATGVRGGGCGMGRGAGRGMGRCR